MCVSILFNAIIPLLQNPQLRNDLNFLQRLFRCAGISYTLIGIGFLIFFALNAETGGVPFPDLFRQGYCKSLPDNVDNAPPNCNTVSYCSKHTSECFAGDTSQLDQLYHDVKIADAYFDTSIARFAIYVALGAGMSIESRFGKGDLVACTFLAILGLAVTISCIANIVYEQKMFALSHLEGTYWYLILIDVIIGFTGLFLIWLVSLWRNANVNAQNPNFNDMGVALAGGDSDYNRL